ncbi:MAG TPA: aldo/keto reductase [Anaerolineaceae bacterium]
MRYLTIPGTSFKPSILCLGTGGMGATIDRETSFALLDTFLERGGTFIDTAKIYNDWIPGETSRSEKLIGEWLRLRKARHQVVLATKGAHPALQAMHVPRLSPAEITNDLEASLRHLQVEVIDLYWLHRDDPARSIEEIIETLASQVKAGKIRHYGCSNWRLERIQAAQAYASAHGLPGFAGVQNLWNLAQVNRQDLPDPTIVVMDALLWQYHHHTGMAAVPFSSQANGFFQKMEEGQVERIALNQRRMYGNSDTEARLKRLQVLKQQTGFSTSQIVLGYLAGQPFPTFPIIGPKDVAQLNDSLSAADISLTAEQIAFLLDGQVV